MTIGLFVSRRMHLEEGKQIKTSDLHERPKHRKRSSLLGQIKGLFKNSVPHSHSENNSDIEFESLKISDQECIPIGSTVSVGVETDASELDRSKQHFQKSAEDRDIFDQLSSILTSDLVEFRSTSTVPNDKRRMNRRGKSPSPPRTIKKTRFQSFVCLLDAATEGNMEEMQKILQDKGIHPDMCNADGITALHCAVGMGNFEMTAFLLERGANPNVADDLGWTPLHSAAYLGREDLVKILLNHLADVEAADLKGQAPIGLATKIEVIQLLTEVALSKNRREWVTALYDFEATQMDEIVGDELFFPKGSRIRILDRSDSDWWLASIEGATGMIPRQFVQ